MSQTDFGERLGVNSDVIGNIELNRLVHPEQKLSLLKLICKEFSVNEEWLMNGTEPIIVKTYLELDPSVRKMLIEHFKSHLLDQLADETEKEPITEELEAEYKKSRSGTARKTASSASSITDGKRKTASE